jgi:hypothetical protein
MNRLLPYLQSNIFMEKSIRTTSEKKKGFLKKIVESLEDKVIRLFIRDLKN